MAIGKAKRSALKLIKQYGGIESVLQSMNPNEFTRLHRNWQGVILDECWSYLVKLRAGFKCELTGDERAKLNAHHLINKGTTSNRLRWELDNGICISVGLHLFHAHSGNYEIATKFRERVQSLKGQDVYDRLGLLKRASSPDRAGVFLYYKSIFLKGGGIATNK
jgi:hypothetical protein